MKIHGKDFFFPVVNSENHVWDTSSFLLCSFLKEIHTDNKSIHPCWRGVKELTHIICTQTGYDTLIVPKSVSLQHSYNAHDSLLTWRRLWHSTVCISLLVFLQLLMRNVSSKRNTISLLTLRMDLILYFLQKLKVRHHKVTMHCDVLVLAILVQWVVGGVGAKKN